MTQASFSQIKSIIKQYINSSVAELYIAVAWFTHRDLFQVVLPALNRNVRVSVILIDDIINMYIEFLDVNTDITNCFAYSAVDKIDNQ